MQAIEQLFRRKEVGPNGEDWITEAMMEMAEDIQADFDSTNGEYLDAGTEISREIKLLPDELRMVVLAFACNNEQFEEFETRNKWPARSAKLVLRIALKELASLLADRPAVKFQWVPIRGLR